MYKRQVDVDVVPAASVCCCCCVVTAVYVAAAITAVFAFAAVVFVMLTRLLAFANMAASTNVPILLWRLQPIPVCITAYIVAISIFRTMP